MKITYCDICQALIKTGDKKFILGLNEVQEEEGGEKIEDFTEFVQRYKQGINNVKLYEICKECKKILEHLFKMRKKERKEILKEIEKTFNAKPQGEKE